MKVDRISKNEERLDKIVEGVKNLENALNEFASLKKDIMYLNKYYGSENWFKDKEAYEKGKIPYVKAGVLSEDAVWNTNENIAELKNEMKKILKGE